jgi:hypothetical protein
MNLEHGGNMRLVIAGFTVVCSIFAAVFSSPSVMAQTCATPVQLQSSLSAALQSDVISLSGVNPINCTAIPMTETWTGGKLILSDSPESPTTRGKLYEDGKLGATSGATYNRIFVYHANGNSTNKLKFAVLVKNLGSATGTLTVQQKGTAGPTTSYAYGGKMALYRWLTSAASAGVSVPAGSTVRLDTTFDSTQAASTYLMHGIWDYSFTQPHQVTICALDPADDPITVGPTLPLLARSVHKRGTFPNADKIYNSAVGNTINTSNGIQQFSIAQQTSTDTYAAGVDATDGSAMTNLGNYGVLYRIHLNAASGDGRNLGFLLNPRAGSWGGAVSALAGITPGGSFLIPASTTLLGDNTKGAVEAKYSPGAGITPWLQFMPTGGSSLPLRLVAVPY